MLFNKEKYRRNIVKQVLSCTLLWRFLQVTNSHKHEYYILIRP